MSKNTETKNWKKRKLENEDDEPHGEIWILNRCQKEIDKLKQPRMLAKVYANLDDRFCQYEELTDLTEKQFNLNEGKVNCLGREVHLSAAKGDHVRLYGVIGTVSGVRAFFVTKAILKQSNKLNAIDAETAANRIEEYLEEIPNASIKGV